MKKSFFYLAAGALALTACTSEEVLDESSVHSNAIGFENVVSKQTRATEITNGTFNTFGVFGYYAFETEANPDPDHGILVFNNETVNRSETNPTEWTYNTLRYWVPEATYYFYAYSCGGIKLGKDYGSFSMDVTQPTKESRAFKITNYICDNTHQHDLLFDKNEGLKKTSNSTVQFQFKHILTKIDAKFFSDFAPEYTIEISNVQISNIRNRGDYNSFEEKWTNQARVNTINPADENPTPYVMLLDTYTDENGTEHPKTIVARKGGTLTPAVGSTDETPVTVEDEEPSTDIAFVMPYTYIDDKKVVTISFTATIKKDGETVLSRNMSGTWKPTWLIGYQYTYNIKIGGSTAGLDAIIFQTDAIAIDNWENGTDNGALNDPNNTNTIVIKTNNN